MIREVLRVGRWVAEFIFADDGYDEEAVLGFLYDIDAPVPVMRRANRIMESKAYNRGFTFCNPDLRRAVVVVGPTTSGRQFINTFSHEINHLSEQISEYYGLRDHPEASAYLTGDTTMALTKIICKLGCERCR